MKAIILVAIALLSISLIFAETRRKATLQDASLPRVTEDIGQFSMKLVRTFSITSRGEPPIVKWGGNNGDVYFFDYMAGRIRISNWRSGEVGEWVSFDPARCSPEEAHFGSIELMNNNQNLLILNCGQIEIIEISTLKLISVVPIAKGDEVQSFQLSPDEHYLLISAKRKSEKVSLVYQTKDWSKSRELSLTDGTFTLDGNRLIAFYSRSKNPASHSTDECGFKLIDFESGKTAAEFSRSTSENSVVCPQGSGLGLPGHPNNWVTIDALRGAIAKWDLTTGELILHLVPKSGTGGPAPSVESLGVSFDGKLAAGVRARYEWGVERGFTIWDLVDGKPIYDIPLGLHADSILGVSFSKTTKNLLLVHSDRVDVFEYINDVSNAR